MIRVLGYIIESTVYIISRIFNLFPDFSVHFTNPKTKKKSKIPYYQSFVNSFGYQFEEHKVTSEDGYILTLWRIPSKLNENSNNKKPVILQHGLLDDSWTWFALQDEGCLPFLLVDKGFDVWLPNTRGNMFSTEHIDKKKNSSNMFNSYWHFSFDEMAKYDTPAVIKFIQEKTNQEKIDFVGHSQGTTIFMLAFILYPELMNKSIGHFCTLGMVANLKHAPSPLLRYFCDWDIFNHLSFGNFLNPGIKNGFYFYFACKKFNTISSKFISSIIQIVPTKRIDFKKFLGVMHYEPGGSSYRNIIHWLQCYKKKDIYMFDFNDEKKNKKVYSQPTPPKYDKSVLKEWKIPMFMVISDTDPYSDKKDIFEFCEKIPNQEIIKKFFVTKYNHLDYLWSHDSKNDIFVHIVKYLAEFDNKDIVRLNHK